MSIFRRSRSPSKEPPVRGKRRAWRWTKRIALGFLAFVLVAVGALLIVLHTDYGRNVVREQVVGRLNTTFTGGATIGKLEGSPFGDLVALDVVINGPDGKPAITIKRLKLKLGIMPLISHQARISGLTAEDVDIDMRRDENGELEFKNLIKPGPKSAWSVEIPDIVITRAHVKLDTGTEILNVDNIEITGAAHMPKDEPLDARVAVTASWRERDNAPIRLETAIHIDPVGLTSVPSLKANVGAVSLVATNVQILQAQDVARPPVLSGVIELKAPRDAVAKLAPQIDLPDNIELRLAASPVEGQPVTHLELAALVGPDALHALLNVDLTTNRVVGVASTNNLDITKLSGGKVVAQGGGFVVVDILQGKPGKLPIGHAMIHASGTYADFPETALSIALSSDGERVLTTVGVTNPGLTAGISGHLKKLGDVITLEHGVVVASSTNPSRASAGKAPVHGSLNVNLSASGALLPEPSLQVSGRVAGNHLLVENLSVAKLDFSINARRLPDHPIGKAVLSATGVSRGSMYLRQLNLTAANREDGKIAVTMRSQPKQDPWVVDADALITPGQTIVVDLQRHHVRAGNNSEWNGTGGRVSIGKERIEVKDFKSTSRDGVLALAGVFYRAGAHAGDLSAKIDANAVTLDNLSSTYRGTIDAHVDVERKSGLFAGTVQLKAAGVALHPSAVGVDAEANIQASANKLLVDARAGTTVLGHVKLALDVDAPKDIANVVAWKRLQRDSIRKAQIVFEGIDVAKAAELAGLQGEYAGSINGDIVLSPTTAGGIVAVRDLMAPPLRSIGPVTADLAMSQNAAGEIVPTVTAKIDGLAAIVAEARIHLADRPFDPLAWRQRGRGALHGASVRAENVPFDPGLLDRFGIVTQARGTVSVVAEVGESARTAKLGVTIRQLRGSPIAQPIQIDFNTTIDDKATTTTLVARTREVKRVNKVETPFGPESKLLDLQGSIPLTMAELIANPRSALDQPLKVVATVPHIPAKQLLQVFGRMEVTAGDIDGKIEVAGTVGNPTVTASLVGTNIQVPPGAGGKPVKTVKRLAFDASWDGTIGKLTIDGTEDNGMLKLVAEGNPNALENATVKLTAKQFDMVPLLAFAPGPAGGAAGRLDADLNVKGLDPRTMTFVGQIHLNEGRLPLAPQIGTLRRAKIDIVVGEHDIKLKVDGKLGGGSVVASGTVALDHASPTGGDATLTLRKVSPIGVVEPIIDADVTVKLHKEPDRWVADVFVRNGNVDVPSGRGEQLKQAGAPPDMVFMNGERITNRPMKKEVPTRPAIVANVTLYSTHIKSAELRGVIRGKLTLTADAYALGIVGTIDADRGDLDLFGTRYQVERASVRFDGTTDPLLDVRITHDFPEVTTITEVHGRMSKPELIMSSNPGTYSQGQLLGFLLGGEPSGEPSGGARDRATSAGTSFVANKIGGYVKDALPIDLDVLRYEAATSNSSAAITVGTWLRDNVFLAYRQRLAARPDENSGEGQIEYWLSRRVMIEGTAGDRNVNGVDLLWRKRY